jgi:hypothetical protein
MKKIREFIRVSEPNWDLLKCKPIADINATWGDMAFIYMTGIIFIPIIIVIIIISLFRRKVKYIELIKNTKEDKR